MYRYCIYILLIYMSTPVYCVGLYMYACPCGFEANSEASRRAGDYYIMLEYYLPGTVCVALLLLCGGVAITRLQEPVTHTPKYTRTRTRIHVHTCKQQPRLQGVGAARCSDCCFLNTGDTNGRYLPYTF